MTETKTKEVTFISRSPNQTVTVEPEWVKRSETGRVTEHIEGKRVVFEDGRFTTDDPALIDYLRSRPGFGAPAAPSGFMEIPGEPEPTLAEQTAAISRALLARDPDVIAEIKREEQETHNRNSVLTAADSALLTLAGDGSDAEPSPAPPQPS